MQRSRGLAIAAAAALLFGALPIALAHEHGDAMDMEMAGELTNALNATNTTVPAAQSGFEWQASYVRWHPHAGWVYAHGTIMTIAWAVVMPLAIMLSAARSRYHLPAQLLFHIVNGVGVFTGFVYNHATPDLYERNSHHPIGWVVTAFTIAWTIMSLFVGYSEHRSKGSATAAGVNIGVYDRFRRYRDSVSTMSTRGSGSTSLTGSRPHSQDSREYQRADSIPLADPDSFVDHHDSQEEKYGLLGDNKVDRFVSRSVHRFSSARASRVVRFCQIVTEKLLLLLGFLGFTTGIVVYTGLFTDKEIFSGLAHWIKGAIFFWYGLLTLGRWMGAFTEFGWAWNIRPNHPTVSRWKSRVPSAEFVESFVIWLYGASNVFLEHLGGWGEGWSAQDFEHISITLLFFGGGLMGMAVESSVLRECMNTTVELQKSSEVAVAESQAGSSRFMMDASAADEEPHGLWAHPKTYRVPLNPMPGLVILLLGLMMSAHHQESHVSTMLVSRTQSNPNPPSHPLTTPPQQHSQWGSLFVGFAMARAATYITLYIKPPTSHFAARPPSELVASFCLIAGGIMFMISAHDVVTGIEANGFDAMAVFTVTMGLTGLIMAWEVLLYAVKGWAVRKERAAAGAEASS